MTLQNIVDLYYAYRYHEQSRNEDVCRHIQRELRDPRSVALIGDYLRTKKYIDKARMEALFEILVFIQTPAVETLLLAMIDHPNKYLRTNTVKACQSCEVYTAIPKLCAVAIADDDSYVRKMAVMALSDLGDETVIPALLEALETDTSSYVRYEAARALGQFGNQRVCSALASAVLHDDNSYVRWAAVTSLQGMEDDALVASALFVGAMEGNPYIQRASMKALREMPAVAIAVLKDLLTDPEKDMRWYGLCVLMAVTEEITPDVIDQHTTFWN